MTRINLELFHRIDYWNEIFLIFGRVFTTGREEYLPVTHGKFLITFRCPPSNTIPSSGCPDNK